MKTSLNVRALINLSVRTNSTPNSDMSIALS